MVIPNTLNFEILISKNCLHFLVNQLAFPVKSFFHLLVLILAGLEVFGVVSSSDFCSLTVTKQQVPIAKEKRTLGPTCRIKQPSVFMCSNFA